MLDFKISRTSVVQTSGSSHQLIQARIQTYYKESFKTFLFFGWYERQFARDDRGRAEKSHLATRFRPIFM
jgi:hypothetical protein